MKKQAKHVEAVIQTLALTITEPESWEDAGYLIADVSSKLNKLKQYAQSQKDARLLRLLVTLSSDTSHVLRYISNLIEP